MKLPISQILEQIVEVVRLVPQEGVRQRLDEQFVEVPLPQIMEEIVEEFKIVAQEQSSERIL